ncbi:hypothetical protein V6N12_043173 [Hibiscus sabdariffa]|uniref:Protein EXECUTER 2, chloroplastic n=1 Tax=Hibiscus sabdariffa TaxID=183260 RepID=A0ABR2DDK1_9ROSI
MIVSNHACVAHSIPLLKPFSCIDFAPKKSSNFSFVLGWNWSLAAAQNTSFSRHQSNNSSWRCCCNSHTIASSEWDWNRWTRHFSEIEQSQSYASLLKFQLEDAIDKEDFEEAAKLKLAIAEVSSKDSVAEIMSQLKNAIDEERYHDASWLSRLTGSGLCPGPWSSSIVEVIAKDSDDPFGRLVRITPGVGRFVARSYSPSWSMHHLELHYLRFLLLKKTKKHMLCSCKLVLLAHTHALEPSTSFMEDASDGACAAVENASVIDIQGNDEAKTEKSDEKGANIEGATEEGIKSVINFLKNKIPGLKVKVMNVDVSEEVIVNDSVEELIQEDDEKTAASENSEDETNDLEEIQPDGVAMGQGGNLVDDRNDLDMKLFIDSFLLHVPKRSLDSDTGESKASKVKIAAIAAQGVSELMPPDVAKSFWGSDKASSKVSRDVREIVKLAVSQAQRRSILSEYTNFNRISSDNGNLDLFEGLYVGAFGPYGTEIVQLRRKYGHWSDADDDLQMLSSLSQGRIAEFGFCNPRWVEGELLQLNGKGIGPYVKGADLGFLYIVPEQSFLVLFNRLILPD